MTAFEIREANLDDLEQLRSFEQGIIRAERPFDPTIQADPVSYYDLKEMLLSADACIMVAIKNDMLVGSGFAQIRTAQHFLTHKKYCYLGFMYTVPAFRGKGINGGIVAALQKWAKERGLTEVRLTVYDDNIAAIKAYEKVGFKKHLIEMRYIGEE